MKEKNKFLQAGVMIFIVSVCIILFFFFVYKIANVFDFLKLINKSLISIITGLGVAYLLNPVVKKLNNALMNLCSRIGLDIVKAGKHLKSISIAIVLIAFIVLVFLLFRIIIPEVWASLKNVVSSLDSYSAKLAEYVREVFAFNTEIQEMVLGVVENIGGTVVKWVSTDFNTALNNVFSTVSSITFTAAKTVINVVVGLCVSVYVLGSKDSFVGGLKRMLYATFNKESVNVVLAITRKVDAIFGGYITGKLIDSLVIGIICFLGCSILKTPYTLLISVVIGVTNIIPLFGPWIGAIPSIVLVLSNDPKAALLFAIFVLFLQQFDGNVLGPNILGDSTGLPPFWVVFAISLGGGLFGVMGMIFGTPTFAVFYFLFNTYIDFKVKEKNLYNEVVSYADIKRIDPETGNVERLIKTNNKKGKSEDDYYGKEVSREIAIAARISREKKQESFLQRINNAFTTMDDEDESEEGNND